MSLGGMVAEVAEVAVAEVDAEPTDRVSSDSMVERCTESFSSTSFVVIELMTQYS